MGTVTTKDVKFVNLFEWKRREHPVCLRTIPAILELRDELRDYKSRLHQQSGQKLRQEYEEHL